MPGVCTETLRVSTEMAGVGKSRGREVGAQREVPY